MPENSCETCKKCAQAKPARWREDFPVQWENDDYVTRREMVKFLGLGSFLMAGANFVAAGIARFRTAEEYPALKIGSSSLVPAGESMLFTYPTAQDPCILIRSRSGHLRAYSQVCTHLSCAVINEYIPGNKRSEEH